MRATVVAFTRLIVDTDGQDLIEYGLLVALVTVTAILAVTAVGTTIDGLFWQVIADGLSSSL